MTKWKYAYIIADIRGSVKRGLFDFPVSDVSLISQKIMNGEITAWEKVKEFGLDEWELISVTPIAQIIGETSLTESLLYTFKKPIE